MSVTTAPSPVPVQTRTTGRAKVVRGELLKIWTTNTWWIFGILAVGFTALFLLANCAQVWSELDNAAFQRTQGPQNVEGMTADQARLAQEEYLRMTDVGAIVIRGAATIFTSGQFLGLLFMVILGALVVTNEYHHQTATTTFLTTPRRTKVILAKLAAAMILAGAFWLVTSAINLVVGAIFLGSLGHDVPLDDGSVLRSVLMNLVAYVIWAVLGVGLGVLIRNQLGATIVGAAAYLVSFIAAFLVVGLIHEYLIKEDWAWQLMAAFPGIASQILVSPERMQFQFDVFGPPWWVGGLVLVGYGLVAGVIGTAIMRKRDIS